MKDNRPLGIAQKMQLTSMKIEDLLALRLIFDDPKDIVDLDQDLRDLEFFPERLHASYRQEWCTFIARALNKRSKHNTTSSEQAFCDAIQTELDRITQGTDQRYSTLLEYIKYAQHVESSNDVVNFPNPLKRRLEKMLLL